MIFYFLNVKASNLHPLLYLQKASSWKPVDEFISNYAAIHVRIKGYEMLVLWKISRM